MFLWNKGYFRVKRGDNNNVYGEVKCNKKPIGYYLDGYKHKRCYYKCEKCSKKEMIQLIIV